MKVIVTGGTGLIGQALCQSLVDDRHDVTVLTRNPNKSNNLPASVLLQKWGGQGSEGWQQAIDGADAVVNLAGEGIADSRWSPERKQRIRNSRVQAGGALLRAIEAAKNKPKVLVQASAVGYYGVHGDEVITEKDSPGLDFLAKICWDWESSSAPVKHIGVRRPVIRTGVVLSMAGGALPKQVLPFKVFAGGPIGSGKQWYSWIHVEDEVRAIRFLIDNDQADGAYNLTAPNPVTNKEFSDAIGKVLGRPAVLPAPAVAFQLLFGEMSTVLLDGQRVLPQRLLDAGFQFKYPTAEAALRQLLRKN